MLKKHGQLYLTALIFFDSLAITFSWWAAYEIRFELQWIPVIHGVPAKELYLWALLPIWIIFMINFRVCGLFKPLRGEGLSGETLAIIKVTVLSILMLTALSFFYRGDSFSRVVAIYFGVLVIVALKISHALVRQLLLAFRGRGLNLQRILVVGAGELGQTVVEKISRHPEIGFSVVGFLTGHIEKVGTSINNTPVLGLYQNISKIISEHRIDQIFVALPFHAQDRLEQILCYLNEEMVDIKVVTDLLQYMNVQSGVEELDGLPIVNLAESPLYGWNGVLKRISDVVLSLLALVASSPLMLLIAVLIKLESKGPVYFRQERVGLDGKIFKIIKFRSMYAGAENETGPIWTQESDKRRTRFGAMLRKVSLDELPQLFNVLLGDMSLVGPRPERPMFIEEFKQTVPDYMLRLRMKAGLTGWAQVNGWRGNSSIKKRIECDLYYIHHWSLLFDLKIILLTIFKGFVHRHAY